MLHRIVSRSSLSNAYPLLFRRGIQTAKDNAEEYTFEVTEFKGHRIDPPDNKVTATKDELVEHLKFMRIMRHMELKAHQLYQARMIRGFCHLYDGQEAIVSGMEAALKKTDSIITSYRDHCTHLGRGGTVKGVIAELFGRADGASKGVGGSMHLYHRKNNFFGGAGIVGAQIPLGAGLGFAHKYREDGGVAVALYGDGAANQGQKYEALNLSALWKLPVIFICENNQFGMGTAVVRAAFEPNFYKRGDYVPGISCDGQNVLAVKKAIAFAKEYAVKNGPIVIEMDTYRFHGHSMSDPGLTYRTKSDVEEVKKQRDPLQQITRMLESYNLMTEMELKEIDINTKKYVEAEIEEAKKSPQPDASWLYRNVYVNPSGEMIRGVESQGERPHEYHPYF